MKKREILEYIEEYAEKGLFKSKFIAGKTKILASGAVISPLDVVSIVESALQFWYTDHKFCSSFRKKLSEKTKRKHTILCNSGSSASLLAISACCEEWAGGRYIVTTAMGFPTTVAPIYQNGKMPIYIDIDPHTLSPDYSQFREVMDKYGNEVCGVIFAFTLGFPFNEHLFAKAIISPEDQFFILDACDALGVGFNVELGFFADVVTLSFFPAHQITSLDYEEPIIVRHKLSNSIEIRKIGSFVNQVDPMDYQCLSFDKNGKINFQNITNLIKHKVNELLYKVTVQTGRNSIVSGSHSVFTKREDQIIPVKVNSLSVGDFILVPNNLPNVETTDRIAYIDFEKGSWKPYWRFVSLDKDLAEFLGFFVAEGSYNYTKTGNFGVIFTFGKTEDDYVDRVKSILYSKFGIKARSYVNGSKIDIRFSNKGIYQWLESFCGKGSENKKVPTFIFTASSEVKQSFIDAYYKGDGCIHKTYGKHKGESYDSVTVSKELAIGLHYLLLQLGINARFSLKAEESERDFGSHVSKTNKVYSICFSKRSILDADGFRGEHGKKTRKIGDLSLAKITKIESVESSTDYVYDLSVEGYENFIGGVGAIALHNTAEGGAVLTNNEKLQSIISSYASWGRDCYCLPGQSNTCGERFSNQFGHLPEGFDHKYVFSRLGYNLKMTEMQAALGISQLERLDEFVKIRRYNFDRMTLEFSRKGSNYFDLIDVPDWSRPSPFGFPMLRRKDAPFSTNDFVAHLERSNIATRRLFGGNLTKQPAFERLPYVKKELSGSNRVMNDLVWTGIHPGITDEMIDYILDVIEKFFKERGL